MATTQSGLAWARLTAGTSGTEATKREPEERGNPPFPRSYLNLVRTWLPRSVGHRSLRMSWFQERLTMLIKSAPRYAKLLRIYVRYVDAVASKRVTSASASPGPHPQHCQLPRTANRLKAFAVDPIRRSLSLSLSAASSCLSRLHST